MGIFTPSGYSVTESVDIENMSFIESKFDNPFEAGMNLVVESENNYNMIMKAIAMDELAAIESTGHEMVYEASNISNIFKKFIEFFKNLWEKIKGIFKKFFAFVDSIAMKDKDFVKKYKVALNKVNTKDFVYSGFKFTNLDAEVKDPQNIPELKKKDCAAIGNEKDPEKNREFAASLKDDSLVAVMDKFRATVVGKGSKVESGDFANELFMYFRDGKDSKEDLENISVNEYLREIEGTADMKKRGEKALKEVKKSIDEIIKQLETAEKKEKNNIPASDEASAKINAYSALNNAYKEAMTVVQLFTTAKLKAIKDQNAQAKAICVKLLTYSPKNESAGFVHTEGGSYLSNVVLR